MTFYKTRQGIQKGTLPAWKRPASTPRPPQPRYAFTVIRDAIYIRDKGQCQYCGIEVGYYECNFDHVVPWNLGGRTEVSNLVVACQPCNKLKGRALIPLELRPI